MSAVTGCVEGETTESGRRQDRPRAASRQVLTVTDEPRLRPLSPCTRGHYSVQQKRTGFRSFRRFRANRDSLPSERNPTPTTVRSFARTRAKCEARPVVLNRRGINPLPNDAIVEEMPIRCRTKSVGRGRGIFTADGISRTSCNLPQPRECRLLHNKYPPNTLVTLRICACI